MEKIKEILLAGAIGDAYGYCVEFDSFTQITKRYGSKGIQLGDVKKWIVSDDTQMTIFCFYAIKENLITPNIDLNKINSNIFKNYLDWYITQFKDNPNSQLGNLKSMQVRRAPGNTCLLSLQSQICGTIEKPINNSKGCGGIMRVAPIAFLNTTLENIFKLGNMQAAITHGHPCGFLSSGFFATMLKCAMEGEDFFSAYNKSKSILLNYPDNQEMLNYLKILENSFTLPLQEPDSLNQLIGEGWIGEEALGIALYSVLKGKTFEECLWISANHNGDSDSTASLAAQLFVAFNGLPEQYQSLYEKLDVCDAFNICYQKK